MIESHSAEISISEKLEPFKGNQSFWLKKYHLISVFEIFISE